MFIVCKYFFWPQILGDCLHVRAVWLWFSIRMSKRCISTLHPVYERGVFPPENQQGSSASVETPETAYGVAVSTANSSPFNPVPFNEEKLRLRDVLSQKHSSSSTLHLLSWDWTQTKSRMALRKVNWSHSPDNNTMTRATAQREHLVWLCKSNNCLQSFAGS